MMSWRSSRGSISVIDPGTGKSMLARSMTEMLPRDDLQDIIVYHNPEDPNEPKIRVVPAGKSRVLPVQKRLQRAERLARRAARNPNPEVTTALVELAPVLRAWGRRAAANEIESASTGKPRSEARADPVAQ